jgi:hypothetical protein
LVAGTFADERAGGDVDCGARVLPPPARTWPQSELPAPGVSHAADVLPVAVGTDVLAVCPDALEGVRTRMLIPVLADSGLRASELLHLLRTGGPAATGMDA